MDVEDNELCKECSKRGICATLCPEAELYASQDEVNWADEGPTRVAVDEAFDASQRPMPKSAPPVKHVDILQPRVKLSKRESEFVALRLQGKDLEEIRSIMQISNDRLWDLSRRIRAKMEVADV